MTLPSEIKELQNKIKELKAEKDMIGSVILMQVGRIIRESDFIDETSKDKLVEAIWKGRN